MKKTLGIIGFGNMGSAIAERLKDKFSVVVFEKDQDKTASLSGIAIAKDINDLFQKAYTIILAVKPQDFDEVLAKIKGNEKGKFIVSIAAGIPTAYIEKQLSGVRVIRVMPNLPAKIGQGMICLCRGRFAIDGDLQEVENLFKNLGNTLILDENLMDAATAVSGSGPGFLFNGIKGINDKNIPEYASNFAKELSQAAIFIGFDQSQANILADATVKGSIKFLEATKINAEEARNLVTSKGGTTEAGLKVLNSGGTLKEAVQAALTRAKELSKGS
ncbi:MAG: pyrroline-5-carboxylate reductase [Candidatus Omnitrophica bacterium]|nr:pyrroline-5-carboxylate reductase [Candidatus Omnitrophota bacterium]MBU1870300.1 pyrroline-5-carboxylate reductase [Candidatus Omnitrophota bacterium]